MKTVASLFLLSALTLSAKTTHPDALVEDCTGVRGASAVQCRETPCPPLRANSESPGTPASTSSLHGASSQLAPSTEQTPPAPAAKQKADSPARPLPRAKRPAYLFM